MEVANKMSCEIFESTLLIRIVASKNTFKGNKSFNFYYNDYSDTIESNSGLGLKYLRIFIEFI